MIDRAVYWSLWSDSTPIFAYEQLLDIWYLIYFNFINRLSDGKSIKDKWAAAHFSTLMELFFRLYSTWENWFLLIEKFNFKLLSSSVVRASDFETINQSRVSSSLTESRYAFEWLARAPRLAESEWRKWKFRLIIEWVEMNYARKIKTRWTLKWLIKYQMELRNVWLQCTHNSLRRAINFQYVQNEWESEILLIVMFFSFQSHNHNVRCLMILEEDLWASCEHWFHLVIWSSTTHAANCLRLPGIFNS